jgi:predicted lipase
MYVPTGFDKKKAIEIGQLVSQAYIQIARFTEGPITQIKSTPWELQGDYKMVGTIVYDRVELSFDVFDEDSATMVDEEMDEIAPTPVSFSLESTIAREYPMGFVATSKTSKEAYLIFRGTVTKQEFFKDAKIRMVPYQMGKGKVAVGFIEVYTACRDSILKMLKSVDADYKLYIGGHSLGAALSVLALPDVITATQFKKPILYNFGCPRVGDNDFVKAYNALPFHKTYRVVNSCDLVTQIPPPVPAMGVGGYYSHVDTPVDFITQNNDVSLNHTMETYITALS